MIPIVAGLLMGAAMGGGIAALQKKDILQGALMGGIGGALGGAFMPGVAGAAAGEGVGAAAGSGLAPVGAGEIGGALANPSGLFTGATGSGAGAGITGLTAPTGASLAGMGGGTGITMPATTSLGLGGGAPAAAGSSSLFGGAGNIGNFLSQNKYALAGGALGGMMAPGEKPPSPEQGNIREYDFNAGERNPLFGQPGQNYYTGRSLTAGAVTPVEDYTAANGGIIALADGGAPGIEMQRYARPVRTVDPAVAAYNAQIMERANQQYNVNLRPGPNQVPGSAGYVAPPPTVARQAGEYTDLINKKRDASLDEIVPQVDYYNHASSNEGGAAGGMPGRDFGAYSGGGLSSLGSYSDGGQLLKGPGDGVSDDIPARIGARQPARLADGEFVVPARIVSELGNGSTDAGAKRLYAMMDRVQKNRKKSIGKGKVAVDSKAHRMLPA
jgi:hypothetical protein